MYLVHLDPAAPRVLRRAQPRVGVRAAAGPPASRAQMSCGANRGPGVCVLVSVRDFSEGGVLMRAQMRVLVQVLALVRVLILVRLLV
jgi:hypothetical protein